MEQKTQNYLTDAELNQMDWNPKPAEKSTSSDKAEAIHPGDWTQAEALPVLSKTSEMPRSLSNEALNMMAWNPIELTTDKFNHAERFSSGVENVNLWTDTTFLEQSDWNSSALLPSSARKVNQTEHAATKNLISHQQREQNIHQK